MRPIYATNLIYTFMDLSQYSHQVFYLLLFYISFYISRWGSYHFSQIFGTKIGRKIFIVMLKLNILHLSLMILEQIVKKKKTLCWNLEKFKNSIWKKNICHPLCHSLEMWKLLVIDTCCYQTLCPNPYI